MVCHQLLSNQLPYIALPLLPLYPVVNCLASPRVFSVLQGWVTENRGSVCLSVVVVVVEVSFGDLTDFCKVSEEERSPV